MGELHSDGVELARVCGWKCDRQFLQTTVLRQFTGTGLARSDQEGVLVLLNLGCLGYSGRFDITISLDGIASIVILASGNRQLKL
jgi:hypothetical protein